LFHQDQNAVCMLLPLHLKGVGFPKRTMLERSPKTALHSWAGAHKLLVIDRPNYHPFFLFQRSEKGPFGPPRYHCQTDVSTNRSVQVFLGGHIEPILAK